jgi:hypothetical protein
MRGKGMRRAGTLGMVMGGMDRCRVKVKDKVRDMVEIVMEDETITDNEMTDTTNRTKVGMDMLNLLRRLQVVREMHHQDLELPSTTISHPPHHLWHEHPSHPRRQHQEHPNSRARRLYLNQTHQAMSLNLPSTKWQ